MRVGLIVPGFSADAADWCIPAVRDLVRELGARHEVMVFALRYPHRSGGYIVDGVGVQAFGGGLARRGARLRLLARGLASVLAAHRRQPFDVLHGLWADEPGLLAVGAARRLGVPAVVSIMGGELTALRDIGYGGQLRLSSRTMIRHALRRAHAVTAGSEQLRRVATAHRRNDRLVALPLGVDTLRFRPGPSPDDHEPFPDPAAINLLHVASLAPVKDPATLLRAMAILAGRVPGAHLHLAGDGPLRSALESLAASLGIGARVTFHGAVAHDRLPSMYRAADLCVLSSRHESQGMVVLEAAACGRATVGTAVGILPELAPPEDVVAPGDPAALADALTARLGRPASLTTLGRVALDRVRGHLTLDRTVTVLCALYDDVRTVRSPRLAPGT